MFPLAYDASTCASSSVHVELRCRGKGNKKRAFLQYVYANALSDVLSSQLCMSSKGIDVLYDLVLKVQGKQDLANRLIQTHQPIDGLRFPVGINLNKLLRYTPLYS